MAWLTFQDHKSVQAKKHHESLLKKHSAGHTAPTGNVDAAAEKAGNLPTVQ